MMFKKYVGRIGGNAEMLREQIRAWLAEDIGTGDVTSWTTIPAGQPFEGGYSCERERYYCRACRLRSLFSK